ncbi:MAG: hypothetical protein L0Z48_02565 [candidate division Zixibacteria bacterium]|nr:hypothetical protein [candidate division Zixibacteria bacterium]
MKKSVAIVVVCSLAFVGLSFFSIGCGSKAVTYDPFIVPRDQFFGRLKTIALGPIWTPKDVPVSDSVKAQFESLLSAELRGAGFTIIPSEEQETLWKALSDSMGGMYDPNTGKADTVKAKAVWEQTYRQLQAKFGVDAVLFPEIDIVLAKLDNEKAKWDGTSEHVQKKAFWKRMLGVTHFGTIRALSFVVSLKDNGYTSLYVNAGGIQTLDKVRATGGFEAVPQEELFAKEERNIKAVRLALDPLLGRKSSK